MLFFQLAGTVACTIGIVWAFRAFVRENALGSHLEWIDSQFGI